MYEDEMGPEHMARTDAEVAAIEAQERLDAAMDEMRAVERALAGLAPLAMSARAAL